MSFYIFLSLITAFFVSWFTAGIAPGWIAVFFPAMVVIFWIWRMNLSSSLMLVLAVGFAWDTFSIMQFGTYLLTFLIIALVANFLKGLFSNIEAITARIAGISILLLVFFIVPLTIQPLFKIL